MKNVHNRCKEINLIELARQTLKVRLVYLFNIDVKDIDVKARTINITTTEGYTKNIIVEDRKFWRQFREYVYDAKGFLPGEKVFFGDLTINNIDKSRYFLFLKKKMGLSAKVFPESVDLGVDDS